MVAIQSCSSFSFPVLERIRKISRLVRCKGSLVAIKSSRFLVPIVRFFLSMQGTAREGAASQRRLHQNPVLPHRARHELRILRVSRILLLYDNFLFLGVLARPEVSACPPAGFGPIGARTGLLWDRLVHHHILPREPAR